MLADKANKRAAPRAVSIPVVFDYLLSHLGFFSVLPVLPLLLDGLHNDVGPLFIGASLFAFNFAVRGASLFCSRLLHRSPIRRAMATGLLMAAAGFVLLPWAPGAVTSVLCLLVAGTGISINGLMARVYVALSIDDPAGRNTVFSAVQVAVNVGAALGPVVANLLLGRQLDVLLMCGVAVMYVLAAVVVVLALPRELRPGDGDVRPPLRLGLLRDVVLDPHVRRVSAITAVGSFLYAQFFSAIVLHVAELTDSAPLRASFFTLNAVLVVVVQIPVSAITSRRLAGGASPVGFLLAGALGFAAAFIVMGVTGAAVAGAFAAVVVFSVAETLFTPMVNTAFSEIPGNRPAVELFNLRQVAATAGESAGAFTGGTLFLVALGLGAVPAYWLLLAVCGAVAVLPFRNQAGTEASR